MYTATINIRTDPLIKKRALKVARDSGVSLSTLINAHLRKIAKSKKVEVSYEPTPYLIKQLKQGEKDYKAGKGSPAFNNAKDAIAWLEKKGI